MRYCLRSLIILFAVAFAFNVAASPLLAANACNKQQAASVSMEKGGMPCHGMGKADSGTQHSDANKTGNGCKKCCDYCKLMSSAMLPGDSAEKDFTGNSGPMFISENMDSASPCGIEYPPRRIS